MNRNASGQTLRPTRWLSMPGGGMPTVDRLAALLRACEMALGLSAAARARIWWRLYRRRT
jgi:hypothetical protein